MPGSGLIDRRHFMRAAGAAFLAGLTPGSLHALERSDAVFASAFRGADGNFGIATIGENGTIIDRTVLPARAHGLAVCPVTGRCVAFARRPGTFGYLFDPAQPDGGTVFSTPEDRHFYGHGQFSPDGRLLFASENDFSAGRGVIGIYDATRQCQRVGEFDAFGIGTHDMSVSDDGRRIIIANGGIETHPDFGRTKLNLDHMQPSLVLIDAQTGALVQKHELPPELSQLSTRHIALAENGRIWFACQFEGSRNGTPPLAGYFAEGEDLRFASLPAATTERLGHYVGAIAVNRAENLVGLTSPRGGLVLLDATTGQLRAEQAIPDAAGIAPAARGVAVSTYDGRLAETKSPVAWDQHLARLTT